MATKQEFVNQIRSEYGDLLSIQEVSKFLGVCRRTARKMLSDTPEYNFGKEVKFSALDIAKALVKREVQK